MGAGRSGRRSATPWFLTVPPEARPDWIRRDRLHARFDHNIAHHAALIVEAPSGSGKTVALAAWAGERATLTAWLTVTEHDVSTAQLLSGVLDALIRVHPAHQELVALAGQLHDGGIPPAQAVLALIEIMIETASETVLIIDDAHLAAHEAFTGVVLPIMQFGRGRLRLVIAGTRELRSWCARPLAHGDIIALQQSALAFSQDEVVELHRHLEYETATTQTTARLWEETQGWPVAVRLALRSGSAQSIAPAAQHEAISHYIETAVLAELSEELRAFVIAATTCNRLTADLAQQLSGRGDARALLEECRKSGLFLDRFKHTSSETIYQWHSTFAQHCREIHASTDTTRYREHQRRAAAWLATRFPAEATLHALEAADPAFALTIIEDHWLQLIAGGQAGVLAAACAQIPAPQQDASSLLLIRACCLDVTGDRTGAEMLAAQARAVMAATPDDDQASARITAAFADLFLLQDHGSLQDAAEHAHTLLTSLPMTTSQYLHGRFLVGWTEMRLRRNPARAISLLSTVAVSAREDGRLVLADRATANLSFALAVGGRFTEAHATLDALVHADDLGEWAYYDGGIEVMSAILIAYWRNDLETVLRLARELHAHGGHGTSYAALGRVHFALAAAELRSPSLYAEATEILHGVSQTETHGVPWPAYRSIGLAKIAMARSDHAAAITALEGLTKWQAIPTTLALAAELFRRLGHRERAIDMLKGIAKPELVSYVYASAQFTKAAIAWSLQDQAAAHQALERSLKAAATEGIITPFTGLDEVGRALLTAHLAWGTAFEGFIVARLATHTADLGRGDSIAARLSAREREIFSYLGTTMTAEEIAAELHVSVNTVRSHQRSIYRKLGVSTRREAIRVRL